MARKRTAMHFAFGRCGRNIVVVDRAAETNDHDIALTVHAKPSIEFPAMMRIGRDRLDAILTLPKGSNP
jgi:hypothetical protein